MRVLTVRQPWAWAIIHGGKDIENRTRNIAGSYRGLVAIHAGLATPEKQNLASVEHRKAHGTEIPTELKFGAVLGLVNLIDSHIESATCCQSNAWAERVTPYDEHPIHHLVLEQPVAFRTPIPAIGRLGLWTPGPDLLGEIQAAA